VKSRIKHRIEEKACERGYPWAALFHALLLIGERKTGRNLRRRGGEIDPGKNKPATAGTRRDKKRSGSQSTPPKNL